MRANNKALRLGIDLMGSENSPSILLQAIHEFACNTPSIPSLLLLGTQPLQEEFYSLPQIPSLSFQLARDSIEMDEHPLRAIREKEEASLCVGLRLLRDQGIDAFISAGNTGALLGSAKKFLPMLPTIQRPALMALMPTRQKPVAVLDVGANVSARSKMLVEFAEMGVAYQKSRGVKLPKVGLLNIGSEALKGTSEIRAAYKELEARNHTFSFAGNIEGKEVFEGTIDVLITDGFTGNVFLKTAEGIASLVIDRLYENIPSGEQENLRALFNDLEQHLHYAEYPGALLCGIDGIVIKCHGYSSPQAFINGIRGAIEIVKSNILESFKKHLQNSQSK